ncbi:MAG: protein kinase [Acidobacteriota bacterium]
MEWFRRRSPPASDQAAGAEAAVSVDAPTPIGPGDELYSSSTGYRVERRLGGGAYGSVFLATRLAPSGVSIDVALKVFHRPGGHDPLRVLRRELSSLLAIQSDRIPEVLDWSLDGDPAFVVMRYFPHGGLDAVLDRGRLDESQARRLLEDLLLALSAAHQASILHLDIKPSNVLLDGHGGYVLTDFGVSQASRLAKKALASGHGTPRYRAPEQRLGVFDLLDIRTDLWGVGATVWAAYSGLDLSLHPDLRVADEDRRWGLPRLRRHRPDCPRDFEDVVMSLLTLDPGDRPGSAAEVLERTRALDGGEDESQSAVDHYRALLTRKEIDALVDTLIDPLLAAILRSDHVTGTYVRFPDGAVLARQGELSFYTFLLLHGWVRIEINGETLHTEQREGTFLGEVATLTGSARTASMIAEGEVWACALNAAELEALVTRHPEIGLRLIRSMAERLAR